MKEWNHEDTHRWIVHNFAGDGGMTAVARCIDMLIGFPDQVSCADDVFCWINQERTRRQLAAEKARRAGMKTHAGVKADLFARRPDVKAEYDALEQDGMGVPAA